MDGKISAEASAIAYRAGIAELAPVIQRLMDLERENQSLKTRLQLLEKKSVPAHLKNVERRAS